MKYISSVLVVTDMEKSKAFYRDVLGLEIIEDFGDYVELTGGITLRMHDPFMRELDFIPGEIMFCGKDAALYFEDDDVDGFMKKAFTTGYVEFVHYVKPDQCGRKVVRIYDPDKHIIEIREKKEKN